MAVLFLILLFLDLLGYVTNPAFTPFVGGGSTARGIGTGIHWHMNLDSEIEYITTDPQWEVIPWWAANVFPAMKVTGARSRTTSGTWTFEAVSGATTTRTPRRTAA